MDSAHDLPKVCKGNCKVSLCMPAWYHASRGYAPQAATNLFPCFGEWFKREQYQFAVADLLVQYRLEVGIEPIDFVICQIYGRVRSR